MNEHFAVPLKHIENQIAEQRTIRKYLLREETQRFVSELPRISGGGVWISEYGSIWLTLLKQPGFTAEANPGLLSILEYISGYTEQFKNIRLESLDSPENFNRQYVFTFYWRAVKFCIVVNCYLNPDSAACIRVQTGTRTEKQHRQVEKEVEVPVYQFIC